MLEEAPVAGEADEEGGGDVEVGGWGGIPGGNGGHVGGGGGVGGKGEVVAYWGDVGRWRVFVNRLALNGHWWRRWRTGLDMVEEVGGY